MTDYKKIADSLDYKQRKYLRRLGKGKSISGSAADDPTMKQFYSSGYDPPLPKNYTMSEYFDWHSQTVYYPPKITHFGKEVLKELD